MVDFPIALLGDLALPRKGSISIGPFGSRMKADVYVPVGVPVIRGTNISDGRSLKGDWVFVTERFAAEIPNCIVEAGDLVFPHRGAIGEVALVEVDRAPMVLSSSMMKFRPDRGRLNSRFAYYYFKSSAGRDEILRFGSQVGTPGIGQPLASLRQFRVPLPSVEVQDQIAGVLSVLDDKIELNRRMNETLEAMAQAIFRDWFVDFGPVRRKLAGATDPVEIMGGLTPDATRAAELAALFPEAFGDGDLPVDWRAGDFGSLAKTAGESVDPAQLSEDTPYIGLEHMPRRSIALDSWDFAGKVSSQKSRFASGQVLFGKLRPYFHKVGVAPVAGVCSTDIVVLDSRIEFDRELVASCASSDAFVAFTDMSSTGTKMPRTSWSHMKSYEMAIADEPVRRAFSAVVRPMHEKILRSVAENCTLAETRDYLLPRLMSGEVRAGAVERVGAA